MIGMLEQWCFVSATLRRCSWIKMAGHFSIRYQNNSATGSKNRIC